MVFLITAAADDRWALRHRMAAPVDSPAYEWWVVAIFGGCYSFNSGGGKYVLLWLFNGEGWGGTETEDTYTSTRKCTHRHTVGTGRGGGRDFRGLGYSGAELSGYGARSVSLKVLKSNNTRFVGSAPNIYSWHGTASTATGPAAPCQSQNGQPVCGKYLKQEVQFIHLQDWKNNVFWCLK